MRTPLANCQSFLAFFPLVPDRASLSSLGRSRNHYVAQAGFQLNAIFLLQPRVLDYRCVHHTRLLVNLEEPADWQQGPQGGRCGAYLKEEPGKLPGWHGGHPEDLVLYSKYVHRGE